MSKTEMTRRNFVAAGSAMALALAASTALAEEAAAPAEGEGAPEGGEGGGEGGPGAGGPGAGGPGAGGPGPMGAPKDVPAAREAAAAEGRTFGYAGAGDWLGVPDDVEVAEEINDFDAVVIGGGHAGTQATLALAEAGAKVAMCEKSTYLMYIGEDAAAWNADFVKNAGFAETWATTIQMMGHFHGREGHGGVAASSIIGNVQMACLAKAYTLGAQVFLGYKGYKVVQAEDGTVTGVIVYDADADRYVKFNCKAVISCAGGYIQNADMCWALLNELQEKYERTGGLKEDFNGGGMACAGDGSGVKMLCWAGGFVDPSPRGHMSLGGGPSGTWGANCHLWLDENMQRFCNEGNITAAGDACSRKTGACYGIIGGDYLKHIASCGLEHTGPNFGRPEYIMDMMYDIETGEVNSQIKITGMTTAERMGGGIYKADSLENLAAGLGIEDVEGFVAAVNHYNDLCYACQDGTYTCDPEFGKNAEAMIPIEGPLYYGFSGSCGRSGSSPAMVTMSGVMADKNLNVEDLDGNPIPGLYCAGADLGGRYGTGYSTPAAGNSIGMALTNGRVAGKSAAAYLGL